MTKKTCWHLISWVWEQVASPADNSWKINHIQHLPISIWCCRGRFPLTDGKLKNEFSEAPWEMQFCVDTNSKQQLNYPLKLFFSSGRPFRLTLFLFAEQHGSYILHPLSVHNNCSYFVPISGKNKTPTLNHTTKCHNQFTVHLNNFEKHK